MQLFYEPNITGTEFLLNETESRHLSKVLRKQIGDLIHVTDGQGKIHLCEIILIKKKHSTLVIKETIVKEKPNKHIHIAIGLTKQIDRFEWFLEKSTEIGVMEFTPLISQRSERRKINNTERLEKVVASAMKQSLSAYMPKVNPLESLSSFVKKNKSSTKLIAHCIEESKKEIKDFTNQKEVIVLIGPEGDFMQSEVELTLSNDYTAISLGNKRLRTETAGIVAATHLCY